MVLFGYNVIMAQTETMTTSDTEQSWRMENFILLNLKMHGIGNTYAGHFL